MSRAKFAKTKPRSRSITIHRSAPSTDSAYLLTRVQAAEFLLVTDQFIDKLIRRAEIPVVRFGFGSRKQVRIRRADLVRYVEQHAD